MRKAFFFILILITHPLFQQVNNQEILREDILSINKLVQKWFDCYKQKDIIKLKSLYYDNILYYGENLNKEQCFSRKKNFVTPNTSFDQYITTKITCSKNKNGVFIIKFTKKAGFNKNFISYPSYLLLFKHNNDFLILGEGDEISDKKLQFNLDADNILNPDYTSEVKNRNVEYTPSLSYISIFLFVGFFPIVIILVIRNKKRYKEINNETSNNQENNTESKADTSTENQEKGKLFEEYVADKFDKNYFPMLNWRSDKFINGKYPESNKYPDIEYEFSFNDIKQKFAVECKYRSKKYNEIEIAKNYQIENYRKYSAENGIPVYIVIGLGGEPSNPDECFIIPLDKLIVEKLSYPSLEKYKRSDHRRNFFFDHKSLSLK